MKRKIASIVIALVVSVVCCRTSDDGKTVSSTYWVKIQSSTFAMGCGVSVNGNEYPVHNVTVSSYLICDHEVTQSEYEKYCKYSTNSPNDIYGKGATYPVYYVNWYDAIVYCNLRSIAEGLAPCYKLGSETDPKKWIDIQKDNEINPQKYCGPASMNDNWNTITCDWNANGYRLPTEAEWEYAARGGISDTDKAVWAGTKSESELDNYAWYEKNSNGKTHEVKKKKPNDFGLYDMTGNVDEWCWDWYDGKQYTTDKNGISNPKGADTGSSRVERGGDWHDYSQDSRVSFRYPSAPSRYVEFLGFRLVRSL